jgi:hypothetical protein
MRAGSSSREDANNRGSASSTYSLRGTHQRGHPPQTCLDRHRQPAILHALKCDEPLDSASVLWPPPWTQSLYERHIQRRLTWLTASAYCRRIVAWIERHGVRADLEIRTEHIVEEIGLASLDRAYLVAMSFSEAASWKPGATGIASRRPPRQPHGNTLATATAPPAFPTLAQQNLRAWWPRR